MTGQTFSSLLLAFAVFLPMLGAAAVVPLSRVSTKARAACVVGVPAITLGLVASFMPRVLGGGVYEVSVLRIAPDIWMQFRVDALGVSFGATIAALWTLVAVYACGYMADDERANRYFVFYLLTLTWTLGVAFAANLITLIIFYELFSVLTYPLIIHEQTAEAMAAGTKYVVYILIGGSLVLLAIVLTFATAGTLSLGNAGILPATANRTMLLVIFWCFVAGFGVKAAIMPLHGWVPDVHSTAPAPSSALLSGVMVATGCFGIARVFFNVFGISLLRQLGTVEIVGYIAGATAILAAILALAEDNLKLRLAYSTISQMAYVTLGLSLLGMRATEGALMHIANHAFMKGTLFLCAGIIVKQTGFRRVSEMAGIASRLPLTMAAFTLSTLAMIGTPPLSGFISKWYLGLGMVDTRQPLYLAVLLLGALLAAAYLLPVVYVAYMKKPAEQPVLVDRPRLEAPASMLWPTVAGAVVTVSLGLFASLPGLPLSFARLVAGVFVK